MNNNNISFNLDDCAFKLNELNEKHLLTWASENNLTRDDKNPDILFYGCGGYRHILSKAPVKVSLIMENVFPNFNQCDYAISHVRDSIGGKNLYFPYAIESLRQHVDLPEISSADASRPFAIFIASQDDTGSGAILRKEFTQKLSECYKHVDCPGKILHNIDIPELGGRFEDDWNEQKRNVISRYKFIISFENSNTDGYITEKLVDGFISNTVPIYWGSLGNLDPFPKNAVICANDYPDFESLLARIREVDENEELYLSMLKANPLRQPEFRDIITDFFDRRQNFLNKILQEANKYKTTGIQHPDRGVGILDMSHRVACIASGGCPIIHKTTPFRLWWQGIKKFHFLRPGKQWKQSLCPLHKLLTHSHRSGSQS